MFKKSLIAVASLLAAVGTAQACSTLVIGKAVSETGNIIVAHNEDNGGRLFNMQHYVPPAKHKKGETVKFEKFAAEIPQVEETLGFYWTQTFVPDGASFADGFFNDAGVVVATNWCGEIFDADRMEVKDGGIEFEHVTFKYKHGSGQPVLNDITFSIKPGETLGIIGGTGSAKSSLVQLIPRLYDAETGTVKVGGVDVRDYNLDVLRREVSMVLQKNVLFSGTILDNLRWGDENASEEECIRVAKLACADEFIERFPNKYNTWIEQGGSNVSGGQKQRLTIARALLRKPKVLILDDSTSAVDTATDAKIRKAFREEIPGTTKIIIAQRISSVQDADRILVLDNGKIDGLGTHEELLKTNAIYQEVYNSQTQGGGDFDKQGGEQ